MEPKLKRGFYKWTDAQGNFHKVPQAEYELAQGTLDFKITHAEIGELHIARDLEE